VTINDDATAQVAAPDPRDSAGAPLAPLLQRKGFAFAPHEGSYPNVVMTVALVALGIYAAFGSPFVILIGQSCAVYAVASMGQSLLMGSAGQIAISGGAFMAIGAFTTGILINSTPLHGFPLPLLVSVAVGWVVGLISGLPGLRFRGLYLLLASLALQFIVTSVTEQYEGAYHPAGLVIPPLTLGSLNVSSGKSLYVTFVIILLIVCAIIWLIERTGIGLAWRALRESEVAAAISGIDTVRWKLYAFAASGAITAAAGSLFAYLVGTADYQAYDLTLSISLITMVFIGGIRSRLGALVGAVVITSLPYILQNNLPGWLSSIGFSANWYTNNQSEADAGLFSLLFLLVVLFEPRGIEGLLASAESGTRRLVAKIRRAQTQPEAA
jgi:branched-chain amino acid transport system permease protein